MDNYFNALNKVNVEVKELTAYYTKEEFRNEF